MTDYKNLPPYKRHEHKPMGLMKGFYIAVIYAVFGGFVIGSVLTAIRTGYFLP